MLVCSVSQFFPTIDIIMTPPISQCFDPLRLPYFLIGQLVPPALHFPLPYLSVFSGLYKILYISQVGSVRFVGSSEPGLIMALLVSAYVLTHAMDSINVCGKISSKSWQVEAHLFPESFI